MLQSAKGPMSYCSARTTPTLLGAGETKKPSALFPRLSPSGYFPSCLPASICPGRQPPHRGPEIVSQLRRGQTAVAGLQTEWQTVSGLSCVTAVLDHGQPWLVQKGFSLSFFLFFFTALLGLPSDLWGKQREECGGRRGGACLTCR